MFGKLPAWLNVSTWSSNMVCMRVLVTGGAGFIGSHVVERYLTDGHEVAIIDDLSSGKAANIAAGATLHQLDIADPAVGDVFGSFRPELVNHHAAQISITVSARDPLFDARVNVIGLLNILESCSKYQVAHVIFISSGGAIYGDVDTRPTPETVVPQPVSPYAINKLVGEHYLRFYGTERGLSSTVLRYGNVYGPRQDPHGEAGVVAIFCQTLLRGAVPKIYAYPDEPQGMSRDYVFVGDIARANGLALQRAAGVEAGSSRPFNIAGGTAIRTRRVFETLRDLLGADVIAEQTPAREAELRERCLDIERAATELGWAATTSLSDGLSQTLEYFRQESSSSARAGVG